MRTIFVIEFVVAEIRIREVEWRDGGGRQVIIVSDELDRV